MTRDYILFELPSVEGNALVAWSIENSPFGNAERESDGYIAQQRDRN